jgi:hypothetical protein
MELVNPAAARVFLVSNVQPSSGTTLPPVQQLVATYRARKWGDRIFIETRQGMTVVGGYFPKGDNEYERRRSHSIDQESFLQVLEAHNQQFAEPITQIKQDDAGYVEKLELHQGDQLYVRADLHSDLSSLLAQLDMLKASGHLDKNYRCRPGFHMVFLGDYTDRGANDIEILTLLLRLRMENPTSVHLIRGNHEDVGIQMEYSPEGLWMSKHETDLSNCYKSLPLALCVTVKDESGRNQYVHFSHGAFSPAVDLAPLFESTGSGMVVKQKPHMIERIFENKDEKADRKQKSALQTIKDMPEAATQGTSYQWSDIGHRRAPSTRADPGTLAAGHILSPEDIHEYGRYAGAKSSIKAFFMGHIHIFHEWLVARKKRLEGSQVEQKKVIATTMPVGGAGGAYSMFQEVRQGILLQAAPKVKDWTKQLAASEGRGENMVLRFQGTPCGVYQQFPSQAPGNSELFQW